MDDWMEERFERDYDGYDEDYSEFADPGGRNELNVKLAAVITTLAEVDYAPESALYMGLGWNINEWNTIHGLLESAGLTTTANHAVTITPSP